MPTFKVDAVPRPKFVLAVPALATSDKLLPVAKNPLELNEPCVHEEPFQTNN